MATQHDPEEFESYYLHTLAPLAGARVLEVGCGEGRLIWRYGALTRHVTGLDPNPRRLGAAWQDCPPPLRSQLSLLQGQVEALPFLDHSFELVLLAWSL